MGTASWAAGTLPELRQRLAPHINRLKRKDVLTLPPLRIDSWPLDMERTSGRAAWPDNRNFTAKLAHYGNVDNFDGATLDAFLACINSNAQHLATLRRETGTLKAIAGSFLLSDELSATTDQKFVVFAHHKDAIDDCWQGGFSSSTLQRFRGRHPDTKRQGEIDRFNNDPSCRVFIGQLQAAGASINLQAADNVVFIEASWSPGENDQALSRVYRAGQKRPVLVRFTYLRGSIDEAVNRALARKAAMIAQVLDMKVGGERNPKHR
jgi:SWI/SNF-related matrix-associated actin-dependent regulator 1 of chromatin subfamily A